MAKKLLGLMLAILMAVPTTSVAQEHDSLKGVRSVSPGARILLEMRDGDVIQARLVRVEADRVVVRGVAPGKHPRALRTIVVDGEDAYVLDAAAVSGGLLLRDGKPVFVAGTGPAEPEQAALVARRLGVGTTVEVRLREGGPRRGTVRGKVSKVGDTTLVLGRGKKARAIAYADIASLRRAPMPEGLKVAAFVIGICSVQGAYIIGRGLMALAAEG